MAAVSHESDRKRSEEFVKSYKWPIRMFSLHRAVVEDVLTGHWPEKKMSVLGQMTFFC